MKSKTFELGQSPRLVFRSCEGGVRIQGWEKDQVELSLRKEAKALDVREVEGALEISSTTSLTAHVPVETTAVLESCVGDVRAAAVSGLHINKHRGDLSLNQVNRIETTTVYGDVQVRESQFLRLTALNGELTVQAAKDKVAIGGVRGDVVLKGATGQLDLRDITGDLSIRDPDGHVDVHDMNGDIELRGNLRSGQYNLQTNGDVAVYLAPTSDVHLDLEATSGRVASNLELSEGQESAHKLAGNLGSGTAQLKVVANNGDIKVRQMRVTDLQDETERARARAEAGARREAERAQRRAEKLRRKGERLEAKARRRNERLAQKAQERATLLRRWRTKWSTPQARLGTENLEEERLAVLRMLAEGKINAEQAEALLTALEE